MVQGGRCLVALSVLDVDFGKGGQAVARVGFCSEFVMAGRG